MDQTKLLIVALFACTAGPGIAYGNKAGKTLPRIAVVGAGIGGTSTGHFLRQLFGDKLSIDVYEANEVGGRLATITLGGKEYEAGGSILHPRNQYMVNFTRLLGLNKRETEDGRLGIYDGKEMLFEGSSWSFVTAAKLFWRYGWDIFRLRNYISDMLAKFDGIYEHQQAGYAFSTAEKLIESMSPDLMAHLHYSLKETLTNNGFSERFIDELAMGALRNNYGQNTSVQAFVGSVSLAGAQPGLWSVEGGNGMVPKLLLEKSKANLIQERVTKIELLGTGSEVEYKVTSSQSSKNYDIVIVATPLHQDISNIKFERFKDPIDVFPHDYHRTVATFIRGQPNFPKFGFSTFHEFPESMFTTKDSLFFNSIGKQRPVWPYMPTYKDKQLLPVWKVFSQKPLTDEEMDALFLSYEDKQVVDWTAYPHYKSSETDIPPFILHDNLFYLNAMELCSSAMEMETIGGHNVALLAYNHWYDKTEYINPDTHNAGTMKGEL